MAPKNVEATMMAFSGSVMNISLGALGSISGVIINKVFVGVSSKDLRNYSTLIYIQILFNFYQLAIVQLIPTMKEIEETIQTRTTKRKEEESKTDQVEI